MGMVVSAIYFTSSQEQLNVTQRVNEKGESTMVF